MHITLPGGFTNLRNMCGLSQLGCRRHITWCSARQRILCDPSGGEGPNCEALESVAVTAANGLYPTLCLGEMTLSIAPTDVDDPYYVFEDIPTARGC
jgi:hypothetical protein